ncbi:dipeptide ABC transporter ATP-binding protein [Niveibacterium sp. 24ML]|uniref:dipeptide ABC transporter ATP-binding protein n=1 Tax=Niveibacterium sp. 24ML TaxID=2985512 RepID=UPI002270113C|nr:dipeptide ABC transporter ATP-binding protein [Niveibacterium sp. 24ML]MCX9155443.1 dipeptide ABC transporter ATP-binding protein [Niveibacterium sp. 24ML]
MSETLFEARDLTRHYSVSRGPLRAKAVVRALDGVSFGVMAGRTLAVVGESGCGKSTLARQITMLESPTSGSLTLEGIALADASKTQLAQLRPKVQMVFQNPYASLNPRKRIGSMLEEPLKIHTRLDATERANKAREMMARVGLRPEHYDRYPHMFSGGQRQRIAIARALMTGPRLVVADEPVSALDVSIQAQVLNLLMDLQRDTGVAYVFISHNLAVVEHIADVVMVMYLGRVVEHGPTRAVFEQPRHPYTQALLAATPRLDPAARQTRAIAIGEPPSPLAPPPGCAYAGRCPLAQSLCHEQVPLLREVGGHRVACHFASDAA